MTRIEFRSWNPEDAEVRAVDGDGMTFVGYAARFNSKSEYLGFYETIQPGAFTRTLKARNEVKAFLNHNTDIVLGSTRAKTLKLQQDDRGLLAEIRLPDTTAGRDLAVSVARGDVSGMSFGFSVPKGGDSWSADGQERTLKEIALVEVSPVTGFPAYSQTSASVRSMILTAQRAEVDVDELTMAIARLEAGEFLTSDQVSMLMNVIGTLAMDDAADLAEDLTEADPAAAAVPLDLLMKQMDLMSKVL